MPLPSPVVGIVATAGLVGLIHSLSPGHWLPVVLVARTRKWDGRQAIAGALVAASGHILLSLVAATVTVGLGVAFFQGREEQIESWTGAALIVFGVSYAAWNYRRHSHCHGHEHHGPRPGKNTGPYGFLFVLGLSPCVAVLPEFLAAAPHVTAAVAAAAVAFVIGVIAAFVGATAAVRAGFMKLDHPLLEHHGDTVAGLSVAALGIAILAGFLG